MMDDALLHKGATVERCVARAREEYAKGAESFFDDLSRQDAAMLNVLRACEAALAMGRHLIRRDRLGAPTSPVGVFALLASAHRIDREMAERLQNMVGVCDVVGRDDRALARSTVVAVITRHLDDFLAYSDALLKRG